MYPHNDTTTQGGFFSPSSTEKLGGTGLKGCDIGGEYLKKMFTFN